MNPHSFWDAKCNESWTHRNWSFDLVHPTQSSEKIHLFAFQASKPPWGFRIPVTLPSTLGDVDAWYGTLQALGVGMTGNDDSAEKSLRKRWGRLSNTSRSCHFLSVFLIILLNQGLGSDFFVTTGIGDGWRFDSHHSGWCRISQQPAAGKPAASALWKRNTWFSSSSKVQW